MHVQSHWHLFAYPEADVSSLKNQGSHDRCHVYPLQQVFGREALGVLRVWKSTCGARHTRILLLDPLRLYTLPGVGRKMGTLRNWIEGVMM